MNLFRGNLNSVNLCKVQAPQPQPLKASWWGELLPSQTLSCAKKKPFHLFRGGADSLFTIYLQDQTKITWTWFLPFQNVQYQDLLFVGFKATPRASTDCTLFFFGCMGLVCLPTFTMKISQTWVDNWKTCVTYIMHGSYGYIEVILVIL